MSEADIIALEKQVEAMKKAKQERWKPLVNKYDSSNPARVLYKCLVNEEEEGKNEDQWIERIELCFDKMYKEDQKLEPQYRLDTPYYGYETTILGIMIAWQKKHPDVEKFLRGKLDFHKVIDGELYMNKWAWGKDDLSKKQENYPTKAKPVFLAVLFGKTEWLIELLGLGANTDYGLFWTGYNNNCTLLTPQELNNELIKKYDLLLKDRLKKANLKGDELEKERKKIREEIGKILLVGGADKEKIKGLSNPQGLKLKY